MHPLPLFVSITKLAFDVFAKSPLGVIHILPPRNLFYLRQQGDGNNFVNADVISKRIEKILLFVVNNLGSGQADCLHLYNVHFKTFINQCRDFVGEKRENH